MGWVNRPAGALAGSIALGLMLVVSAGCSPVRSYHSVLVLSDIAAGPEPTRWKRTTPTPHREAITYTAAGRTYAGDFYRPSAGFSKAGLLLVPGAAPQGKDDPRLISFANTLTRAGFAILVPDLEGLRAMQVQPKDIQDIAIAFAFLASQKELYQGGQAGMAALSYAVGPAVLATLEEDIQGEVDFLLGIGGYHDLVRVITFFTTGYFEENGRWRYLEPNPYSKWLFLYRNTAYIQDPQDRTVLNTIAERKIEDLEADISALAGRLGPEGQAVFALLSNTDPLKTPMLVAALPAPIRADIHALNPAGRDLASLEACLILVHGRNDAIIPYTESIALAHAVPDGQAGLYLLHGLDHVDVQPAQLWSRQFFTRDLPDLWRLHWAVYALLQRRDGITACPVGSD
jgi:hypothetical protein